MKERAVQAAQEGSHRPSTFTALVCAYTLDRWPEIERAIDSLRRQTSPPDEIVLVVDHNLELLARATSTFDGVHVLTNAGPRGLSGARNTGVAAATGDVIGFLDDDAVADPSWVECMLAAYQCPEVVGAGGSVRPAWRAPRPAWFPDEFLWVVGCSYAGLPTSQTAIRNPIGANMSFRREVFSQAGPFDTGMGRLGKDAAGCEETEFSIRATATRPHAQILLQPSAGCEHVVTVDRTTRQYFRRRCLAEGRSKALVSTLAGANAALQTERTYVRRTLPAAIVRGFREVVTGDPSGVARSWAIVEGTALTAIAYFTARRRRGRRGTVT